MSLLSISTARKGINSSCLLPKPSPVPFLTAVTITVLLIRQVGNKLHHWVRPQNMQDSIWNFTLIFLRGNCDGFCAIFVSLLLVFVLPVSRSPWRGSTVLDPACKSQRTAEEPALVHEMGASALVRCQLPVGVCISLLSFSSHNCNQKEMQSSHENMIRFLIEWVCNYLKTAFSKSSC